MEAVGFCSPPFDALQSLISRSLLLPSAPSSFHFSSSNLTSIASRSSIACVFRTKLNVLLPYHSSSLVERRQRRRDCMKARASLDVPDFLPETWTKPREGKIVGPNLSLTAEEAISQQMKALKNNDVLYPDHGVEIMYQFAGFDPFKPSNYFGRYLDLGQFERFRRIFHHSTYRILLGHKSYMALSSLHLTEHSYKQRLSVLGLRPGEKEIFEFTLVQRVGGNWDGYWLTESLLYEGGGIKDSIAY